MKHRYEGAGVAYKYKMFEADNLTLHGHYIHVFGFKSYWYEYRKPYIYQARNT